MGFMDQLKKVVGGVKHKADDLAEKHGDSIKGGIDKAAGLAEKRLPKSKRKVVGGVASKAKGLVDDLAQPDVGDRPRTAEPTGVGDATGPVDPAADRSASSTSDS